MGRAPCCDKANVKKGPWAPDEDAKLKAYIEANGNGSNWIALPQKIGLKRCGKSCRLRWLNYLRPNIKHGAFSEEEDNIICNLYISIGSRWSIIAAQLPGRTDNDIKNYWNTRLKKKLLGKQRKEQQARRAAAANCQLAFKHEMKRETNHENYMLPGMMSQIPYWQQLPASTVMPLTASTNQDQESIRSLLLKLGGRFFDDHTAAVAVQSSTNPMNLRYSTDVPFAHQDHHQLYENSMNIISSSSSTISTQMNSTCSQVINSTNFNVNETTPVSSRPETNMFEGFEGYPSELSELIYSLESSLYGADNMVDGSSTGTSSVESSSWGDMNSLGYPQILSGFEACQPNMPQVSTLDESSYFGPQ